MKCGLPANCFFIEQARLIKHCQIGSACLLSTAQFRQLRMNVVMTECLPSVLIIDENATRASIVEARLAAAGHRRVTVINEMQGIAAKIALHEPDVIVIDLENPNRDMLENIFQLSRAVKRPIAMSFDRSGKEAMQAAIDAGVSAYVVDEMDLSRFYSAPLIAIIATKEMSYGTDTDG